MITVRRSRSSVAARGRPWIRRARHGFDVSAPWIVFLVAVVLSLLLGPLRPEPSSLPSLGRDVITNGGFETEGGWTYTSANAYGIAYRDSTVAFQGNYSAKLELRKPAPVVSVQPALVQTWTGIGIADLADHGRAFGLRMRVDRFAEIFEAEGIEQIWIILTSEGGRELTYIWADFPLMGWNETNRKFLASRAPPELTWFSLDRDLGRDWIQAGFPPEDVLVSLIILANEPGSTSVGTDALWVDEVHLYVREGAIAGSSGPQAARTASPVRFLAISDEPLGLAM